MMVYLAVRKRFRSLATEKFDKEKDMYRPGQQGQGVDESQQAAVAASAGDSYMALMAQYRQSSCSDYDGQRPLMK